MSFPVLELQLLEQGTGRAAQKVETEQKGPNSYWKDHKKRQAIPQAEDTPDSASPPCPSHRLCGVQRGVAINL